MISLGYFKALFYDVRESLIQKLNHEITEYKCWTYSC